MNRFKTSIFGFQKKSVDALLKKLKSEHEVKKQKLENERITITSQIEKLK